MNKVSLEIHDDVVSAINKIEVTAVGDVQVEIPESSVLFDNILSLKLIKKEAENMDKNITFKTSDQLGKKFLGLLEESQDTAEGFVTREITLDSLEQSASQKSDKKSGFKKSSMPNLPVLNISMPKMPDFNYKKLAFILLLLFSLGGGFYFLALRAPKAEVVVIVNSQPLIKSVTIKAGTALTTDAGEKTLKASTVEATATATKTTETTGEKTVGDNATGEVTLVNRTSNDISLSDGTSITYKDSADYEYILDDDVTVPAQSLEDPADPLSASIPGEANVDVTASEIGEDYNIDDGSTLDFENYKKSELVAVATSDFEGGRSELVRVVAEEDIAKLEDEIALTLVEKSEDVLISKVSGSTKLIAGSVATTVSTNEFNGEVGDELDKLELVQTVSAAGLTYSTDSLDSLLDELVEEFVPNGYKLSDEEREVNVEVLGNSDSTVLSIAEADLQVTLKTFVVPDISEERVVEDLAGKRFDDAQRILGSIRNVKTYELTVSPNIPLFRRVPSNKENITLEIKLEE